MQVKENDYVRFKINTGNSIVEKRGRVVKKMWYGDKYGTRLNIYDGNCINHIQLDEVIEVLTVAELVQTCGGPDSGSN